mmetsp:Transcript_37979/g.108492  ORF Transcript_37979/g.108492 Transcript_37979/m.108492 type:complete len:239 (-) Transcript_37979:420-1136(-)
MRRRGGELPVAPSGQASAGIAPPLSRWAPAALRARRPSSTRLRPGASAPSAGTSAQQGAVEGFSAFVASTRLAGACGSTAAPGINKEGLPRDRRSSERRARAGRRSIAAPGQRCSGPPLPTSLAAAGKAPLLMAVDCRADGPRGGLLAGGVALGETVSGPLGLLLSMSATLPACTAAALLQLVGWFGACRSAKRSSRSEGSRPSAKCSARRNSSARLRPSLSRSTSSELAFPSVPSWS